MENIMVTPYKIYAVISTNIILTIILKQQKIAAFIVK